VKRQCPDLPAINVERCKQNKFGDEMMELMWLSITGVLIRVGIDVARYVALRAQRRSEAGNVDGSAKSGVGCLPVEVHPPLVAAVDLSAAPPVCSWACGEGADQPLVTARGRLVCRWAFRDDTSQQPPAISGADA
jgi:hypothetical protein